MTDPWTNSKNPELTENKIANKLEFEDNFSSAEVITDSRQPVKSSLPDSESYLESLEKKLEKLKRNTNILEQLTSKREECLRNLLNESINLDRNNSIDLDASISGESAVLDIYRHICPVQPLSVGETVHIVKHDQLAKSEEDSASETESASR